MANYHNIRNERGQFAPASTSVNPTNRPGSTLPRRDSRGRFTSSSATPLTTPTSRSSFIQSMVVNPTNNEVDVVLKRTPNITYTYRVNKTAAQAIRKAIKDGTSLGAVYNKYCQGNEYKRTIFKS